MQAAEHSANLKHGPLSPSLITNRMQAAEHSANLKHGPLSQSLPAVVRGRADHSSGGGALKRTEEALKNGRGNKSTKGRMMLKHLHYYLDRSHATAAASPKWLQQQV